MDIKELNQRLETLINEFDDNIVEASYSIHIEPVFTSALDREMMRFNHGRLEKEAKTKRLSYEKTNEWKELFKAYKRLKDDPLAEEFVKKFYQLTENKHFYLFNIHLMSNPLEHKEWRELHKK